MKKEIDKYPDHWTDLIGEISCGVRWMSTKMQILSPLISIKPLKFGEKHRIKNRFYVPLSKRNKTCTKKLGLNCIGCPFVQISDATPELLKHLDKFYKKGI